MNNELSVGKEQWSDADESSLDVWTAEEEGMFSKNVSGHVSHQRYQARTQDASCWSSCKLQGRCGVWQLCDDYLLLTKRIWYFLP